MPTELIAVETDCFASSEAETTVRIYATDLVKVAKAMKGKEYLDLSITSGVRRIANIEMLNPEPDYKDPVPSRTAYGAGWVRR